jgi:hypothetical protein
MLIRQSAFPPPPEVRGLIGALWVFGFSVMVLGAAPALDVAVTARFALLALSGAALSVGLWILAARFRGRGAVLPVAVLCLGVLVALAVQVGADLVSASLASRLFDANVVQSLVVSSRPSAALIMRLIAETGVILYIGLFGVFAISASSLLSLIETRERDRLLVEARAAADRAQLAALRLQLSPHFLFNTLNAIGALVTTGRAVEAEAMIDRLSDVLRASLAPGMDSLVPLADELAVTRAYLDIEAVRFRDRMTVDYDCPPELDRALTPGFLLQPLVENAVKYAVAPALRPTRIRVSARREGDELVLAVEDDGPGEGRPSASGTGLGLRNVRERLGLLFGARGRLKAGPSGPGFRVEARQPLAFAPEPVA